MAKSAHLSTLRGQAITASGVTLLGLTALLLAQSYFTSPSIVAAAATTPSSTPSCAGHSSPSSGGNCNGAGNGNGGSAGSQNKTFAIAGAVTGLAPGVGKSITLTLENNGPQAIAVQTITVMATGVSGCAAGFLGLGTGYTPTQGSISPSGVVIPANGTITTPFPVKLLGSAPEGCKNVTFGLAYSGTGTQT